MTYDNAKVKKDMLTTLVNGVSSINTALASISSAHNELAALATTYADYSTIDGFDEITALADEANAALVGLFVDDTDLSTAPEIEA